MPVIGCPSYSDSYPHFYAGREPLRVTGALPAYLMGPGIRRRQHIPTSKRIEVQGERRPPTRMPPKENALEGKGRLEGTHMHMFICSLGGLFTSKKF